MKQRLAKADALGARNAIIIGDDELAEGVAAVKALGPGTQAKVALDGLAEALR
jgi:histidyl-tRNA synthetase